MRGFQASGQIYEPHGEVATKLWLLLPLRLYVGLYFIIGAIGKVMGQFLSQPEKMIGLFQPVIEKPDYPYGFYKAFFHGLIQPYPGLFAFLVVFGELLAGLAILTGTVTRLACYAGIFMVLNFFLAFNFSLAKPHNTMTFAVMMLVMIFTGAGRAYGVDHYLRGRVPGWFA